MDTSNDHAKVIYEGNCWMPVKDGNNLYFMDCENDYRIAKVDLTNGEKTLVTDCRVDCYNVAGDKIFFQKNDKTDPAICCINTDGSNYQELKKGNYTAINVTSTYVYFKDFTTKTPYYTSVAAPGNGTDFQSVSRRCYNAIFYKKRNVRKLHFFLAFLYPAKQIFMQNQITTTDWTPAYRPAVQDLP